jgi:HSP20 family molecular chaperone IbpA
MKKDGNQKKGRKNPIEPRDNDDDWHMPRPFRGFGFFDDFEDQFKQMEQQMNAIFNQMTKGYISQQHDPNTKFYGWSYQMGPDGQPHYQELGNLPEMQSSQPQHQLQQTREPFIDLQEGDKEIYITIELPGAEKEDIDLDVTNTILRIEVNNEKHPFQKEIELNTEINKKKTEATYNNGVLSITLEKQKSKKKGKRINIK